MLDLQYGLARVLGARDDVLLTGKGALGFGFTVPHWDWDEPSSFLPGIGKTLRTRIMAENAAELYGF